jgi:hypothetical protein
MSLVDLPVGAPGVVGVELVEPGAQRERLAGMDLDVGALALEAAAGLVDEHPPVGQRRALAGGGAASSSAPIDIAIPQHVVCTSGAMNCIVS